MAADQKDLEARFARACSYFQARLGVDSPRGLVARYVVVACHEMSVKRRSPIKPASSSDGVWFLVSLLFGLVGFLIGGAVM